MVGWIRLGWSSPRSTRKQCWSTVRRGPGRLSPGLGWTRPCPPSRSFLRFSPALTLSPTPRQILCSRIPGRSVRRPRCMPASRRLLSIRPRKIRFPRCRPRPGLRSLVRSVFRQRTGARGPKRSLAPFRQRVPGPNPSRPRPIHVRRRRYRDASKSRMVVRRPRPNPGRRSRSTRTASMIEGDPKRSIRSNPPRSPGRKRSIKHCRTLGLSRHPRPRILRLPPPSSPGLLRDRSGRSRPPRRLCRTIRPDLRRKPQTRDGPGRCPASGGGSRPWLASGGEPSRCDWIRLPWGI